MRGVFASKVTEEKGGSSTKIHAVVDAPGNPVSFMLTPPGQAHDLDGTDKLLPGRAAATLLADKAYDAGERVLTLLEKAGKTHVIPPKSNRKVKREYDRDLYAARHLIENVFCNLKQYRAIPTRYDKQPETSSPLFTSLQPSSGLIDDTP